MTEKYSLEETPPPSPQEQRNFLTPPIIGGALAILLFIFVGGILLGRTLTSPRSSNSQSLVPTPTQTVLSEPTVSKDSGPVSEVPSIQFLLNKQYLDDTYVAIAKEAPYQSVVLSASRIEQLKGFAQYTKVNFFDGKTWQRKTVTSFTTSNQVVPNILLQGWNTTVAPNTKQLASIQLINQSLSIASTNLQNEISVQSTPGLTKFIYQGDGTLTIDSQTLPARIFYSRTYSFNASDLSYLTRPETINSDWLLFWDKEDMFYYIDDHKTATDNSSSKFRLGVREGPRGTVLKTADVSTSKSIKDTTSAFTASFNSPFSEAISLSLSNSVTKATTPKYTWMLATGEGTVVKKEGRTVTGIGLTEFIRQN